MQTQKQLTFEQRVDDRIESLLARVDGVRRGSDLRHAYFDREGEAEARAVAERDRGQVEC